MRKIKQQNRPYLISYGTGMRDSATTLDHAVARVEERLKKHPREIGQIWLRGALVRKIGPLTVAKG
ncbi:hypothetical protein IC762_12525 [Bradyrhizobium genosp. L]|uniref:hypothetical protein n=1 Tax=Bradyrhizobium genosp. L TaxID=83637 RepID=UPI0018A2AFEF|nr:hypothetical protein [Bradyrhizobium genosp. L]QPF81715.1 hypothetical protein IC762_17995 [Bradyrhizobium genosp. L]QPF87067.1 hypothetical protein IC762_12525 [Bradyrhizobium genosp. L]